MLLTLRKFFSIFPLLFAFASSSNEARLYPKCWLKAGECLDQNEGPLVKDVVPQINHNVIGESIWNVTSLDSCMEKCLENEECNYFTWYRSQTKERTCELVGFNLKQACFNLENVCVLLRACLKLSDVCTTCKTGIRPLMNPKDERNVMIFNGVTDDPNYKSHKVEQFSQTKANLNELLTTEGSCLLDNSGLVPRIGSFGGFVDDEGVLSCGGYSDAQESYLTTCQRYTFADGWTNDTEMNQARAFASSVVVGSTTKTVLFAMGGYNRDDGYLDSVEKYESGTWSVVDSMTMPEKKSHFCTTVTKNNTIYMIGGWNISYLDSVHTMKVDPSTGEGESWVEFPKPLIEGRADMACAEVQVGWDFGIMVAGGYNMEGAWKRSVEFFSYTRGEWVPLEHFAKLVDGRHYHGLATFGLSPTVFGGWKSGSLDTMETLDVCGSLPRWKKVQDIKLKVAREKFGYALVPKSFLPNCDGPPPPPTTANP